MADGAEGGEEGEYDSSYGPRKGGNILPFWGNQTTMNMNPLILTNVTTSPYFKVTLAEVTVSLWSNLSSYFVDFVLSQGDVYFSNMHISLIRQIFDKELASLRITIFLFYESFRFVSTKFFLIKTLTWR